MKPTDRSAWGICAAAAGVMLCTAALAPPVRAADNSACTACHDDQGAKLEKSAHAAVACASCHLKHDEYPHPANVPKPVCSQCHQSQQADYDRGVHGQATRSGNGAAPDCGVCHGAAHEMLRPKSAQFRSKVPETCGMCHSEVADQFRTSVHGQALAKGITQAPICTDCHGEHSILAPSDKASTVYAGNIRDTCGSCHGNVQLSRRFGLPADRVVSFDASFHGLAAKEGNETVANCASCHGVHNILPSADPRSKVNPKNLAATCGKCHQGAGKRFAISQVHVAEGRKEAPAMRWVRQFYLLTIPLTIGLMLLHNGGDWLRKLLRLRRGSAVRRLSGEELPSRPNVRMLPFERVEHGLLVISFVMLAWTGFALKYSDQWWARLSLLRDGNFRSVVHRIAAVVFMAVTLTHVISLATNRRLRRHWMELLPKAADAREALANFSYNVGLRSAPPGRSAHSYIEKAEYWAVVWGAIVMIVTGLMLWGNNLMLALFPKTWLDVATSVHFYEAVLATLAIVVWHFYAVIFDPEVYPMDTAWLTGVSVKEPDPHAAPPERREEDGPAGAAAGRETVSK
ncbi:MAG TPA: cytochrome b/b6 domain-containing protein [Bryobacteraceae bacterium]|nr:cytochrome b/b6 domain-containing protein [Bryobacteraceae bacterium]